MDKDVIRNRAWDVVFKMRVRDEKVGGENPYRWQDVSTPELFAGKKVALFSLPGAFTPTCSATHLPGFEEHYDALTKAGIDEVYCLSVNDAFVMNKWGEHQGAENVKLIPDGSAHFTRRVGMLVEKDNLGFGLRSWRYSAVVDDGYVEKAFIEPGFTDNAQDDPFEVSDAETMLKYLKG